MSLLFLLNGGVEGDQYDREIKQQLKNAPKHKTFAFAFCYSTRPIGQD